MKMCAIATARLTVKKFRWDSPPAIGHPGTEYNCRCVPEPDESTRIEANAMQRTSNVITANREGDTCALIIHGMIGKSYDWETDVVTDNSFDRVKAEIDAMAGLTTIDVDLDTPGGHMAVGNAVYSYLKNHPATVNITVHGEASSAGSVILMAGDTRKMGLGAFALIHNPANCQCGDYQVAEKNLNTLKAARDLLVSIYKKETGLSEERLVEMMDAETTLTAEKAVELGFATEIIDRDAGSVEARAAKTLTAINNAQSCFVGFGKPEGEIEKSIHAENATKQTPTGENPMTEEEKQRLADLEADNKKLKAENTELTAKNEVLEKSNTDLTAANEELKSVDQDAIRKEIAADIEEAEKLKADASEAGYEATGSTADQVMRSVITAAGVNSPDSFEGEGLKSIYAFTMKQKSTKDVNDALSADGESDDAGDGFFDNQKDI